MKNQVAATLAIIFGTIYTISRKYQCVIEMPNQSQQFNQPMLQTCFIFIGMTLIFFLRPFIPDEPEISSKKQQSKLAYIIPSFFDVIGTIADTAGLYYTSVSVSQMLKGSTIFFTYLITALFFGRKLKGYQPLWMTIVIISLGLIGYSNTNDTDFQYQSNPGIGNLLIFLSQFIFAMMFIAEQTITKKYNIQVKNAVLWQGIWGFIISAGFIIFFSNIPQGNQTDTQSVRSIIQNIFHCDFSASCLLIISNYKLMLTLLVTGICITPFNYFGLMITKNSSALQRCMVCTSRMAVVWIFSLLLNWQRYNFIQFIGYIVLTYAIYKFNQQQKLYEKIVDNDQQDHHIENDNNSLIKQINMSAKNNEKQHTYQIDVPTSQSEKGQQKQQININIHQ